MRTRPWRFWFPVAALAIAGPLLAGASDAPSDPGVRAIMYRLAGALVTLSHGVDVDDGSGRSKGHIENALDDLARGASALEQHARKSDKEPGFAFRARDAARRTRLTRWLYTSGKPQQADRALGEVFEACLACHSRLRSGDSKLLGRLVSDERVEALPAHRKASLLLAARQFEAGLDTYERVLLGPELKEERELTEHLIKYLTCAIRVKADLGRVSTLLSFISTRSELKPALARDIDAWSLNLIMLEAQIRGVRQGAPLLDEARRLLEDAELVHPRSDDRASLIHYIVASGLLLRLVEGAGAAQLKPHAKAEAYYLLGVAEAALSVPASSGSAAAYYEAAIRTAPRSESAESAWVRLRDLLADEEEDPTGASSGSTESGGVLLRELREVMGKTR